METPFSNRLAGETSPYLLQHAHNPVNWFPWGEEALQLAKEQNKPILVSIGYAACHWCHVMERESFEDQEVAEFMNTHFINIKIDREERPDLDHIYMDAVQLLTGSGGWPLNVFLTPDKQPFFGGTYFPPKKWMNRPSWRDALEGVINAWNNNREAVLEQAGQLTRHMETGTELFLQKQSGEEVDVFTPESVRSMVDGLMKIADKTHGGFGQAPKFPQTMCIRSSLLGGKATGNKEAVEHAHHTLLKMCAGGLYDQTGGGFARYSTDEMWLVPHFEKMLYDNALLLVVYAEAFQENHDPVYENVIRETISFLQREMMMQDGGYYSALDADSEGEEGKFYLWEMTELSEVLGEDANLAAQYFGATEEGNLEGKNVLHRLQTDRQFAESHQLTPEELQENVQSWKNALMEARSKRVAPGLDDKILIGWNALLITAYCRVFAALGEESYRKEAIRLFGWCREVFSKKEGGLWHVCTKGQVKGEGVLDDYAFFIEAALALQEITGDTDYLFFAQETAEWVLKHFSAPDGFFYFTSDTAADVLFRRHDLMDGATPSGNSTLVYALKYLSVVFNRPEWAERSRKMLTYMQDAMKKHPATFGNWLIQHFSEVIGIVEITVTTGCFNKLFADVLKIYLPNKVFQSNIGGSKIFPLLEGKSKENLIHVCKNYSCLPPLSRAQDLETYVKNHMII